MDSDYAKRMLETFRYQKRMQSNFLEPRNEASDLETLKQFKELWNLDRDSVYVFEEMSKLSESFFHEWEMYYFDASYRYKNKSHVELWENFKKEWKYCFLGCAFNEDDFNESVQELREINNLGDKMTEMWHEYRKSSRDMSVKEELELWWEFKDQWEL